MAAVAARFGVAESARISAGLIQDLTAQKTAAQRAALAGNVPVALAATVHAKALRIFYDYPAEQSRLQINLHETAPERLIKQDAGLATESGENYSGGHLPHFVMYGRPPLGKGDFGDFGAGRGAVMYTASDVAGHMGLRAKM